MLNFFVLLYIKLPTPYRNCKTKLTASLFFTKPVLLLTRNFHSPETPSPTVPLLISLVQVTAKMSPKSNALVFTNVVQIFNLSVYTTIIPTSLSAANKYHSKITFPIIKCNHILLKYIFIYFPLFNRFKLKLLGLAFYSLVAIYLSNYLITCRLSSDTLTVFPFL